VFEVNNAGANKLQLTSSGNLTTTGIIVGSKFSAPLGAVAATSYYFGNDTDTGMWSSADAHTTFSSNSVQTLDLSNVRAVFNDSGSDLDFRIEGSAGTVIFHADGVDKTVEMKVPIDGDCNDKNPEGNICSGTYTATQQGCTSCSISGIHVSPWSRMGRVVNIGYAFSIDMTAGTALVDLDVPSEISGALAQCFGTMVEYSNPTSSTDLVCGILVFSSSIIRVACKSISGNANPGNSFIRGNTTCYI